VTPLLAISLWSWLERLGGIGLILLGLVDNSPFPVPGSMDALTIVLSAHQKDWWPYYAVMATIGGVVGGYATYALAREGGKEELEKRFSKQKTQTVYKAFSKFGFWSLFVPALAPPPFPFSPFVIAAGAFNYSRKRFLWAVGIGRGIRYGVLAYLGSRYRRQIFGFFREYYQPILWTALALAVIGGTIAAVYVWRRRKRGPTVASGSQNSKAA
jgi:membrane protein YqaA with SNARE-associated domain